MSQQRGGKQSLFHGQSETGIQIFPIIDYLLMPEKYVCIYLQILLNIHSHQFILIICHCAGCFFSNVNEISVFFFLFFFQGSAHGTPTLWTATQTRSSSCSSPDTQLVSLLMPKVKPSKQCSSESQGILQHRFRRTAFSDMQHWHHCTLESTFEVVALCKGLSVVCNAAVSLLCHPFDRIFNPYLNILFCTALQANVFDYRTCFSFFFCI